MNRPSARNALGNVFVSQVRKGGTRVGRGWARTYPTGSPPQLLEALAQLREDRHVRVLIFRSGVKGVFCAGGFVSSSAPTLGLSRVPTSLQGVGVGGSALVSSSLVPFYRRELSQR